MAEYGSLFPFVFLDQLEKGASVLREWDRSGEATEHPRACVEAILRAMSAEPPDTEHFVNNSLEPFLKRLEAHFDRQAEALALILEQLTPEGCGHENWVPITTSGQTEQHFICGEPGCTARKTEPW